MGLLELIVSYKVYGFWVLDYDLIGMCMDLIIVNLRIWILEMIIGNWIFFVFVWELVYIVGL
ncbi:hypothetical protein ACE6H2_006298 [Prunus campanulata]